jgi:hypothetical protein
MKCWFGFLVIFVCAGSLASAVAQRQQRYPLSPKIMQAKSALLLCECPRGMAVAEGRALHELLAWGRFQIAHRREDADLVILFSANEYLDDLLTRDGPDTRSVSVDFTIMTIIDPNTGATLWTDSRRWGSWRVDQATKDLIAGLKEQIEDQTKKWTLDEIQLCAVTPLYTGFALMDAEDALAKSDFGVSRVAGAADRLALNSPVAPDFCRQIQLIVGPDNRIIAFEVIATAADSLDLTEVLRHADTFQFTGGKDQGSDRMYFTAESKDKKILIQFEVQGRRSVLSRVRFSY